MPVLLAACLAIGIIPGQSAPLTRAERSHYKETSTYTDVVGFLQDLQSTGAPISVEWMGESTEGKKMPLVIASRPLVSTPAQAKASGKPIIYIQANIHAGEVEGKEAAQALLRDYCQHQPSLLDKVILVVAPIYNIDGNEKFGPQARNRPGQEGPELVGVRANGQNLDLNRDCMKVESPEMAAVLSHVYTWDPDVVMDLHTTDGSRHGYQLTYSPPLHPNTNSEILKFTRDELLPKIRRESAKTGLRLFDYGNSARRDGKPVWETFGYEGRYVTNYGGLRNRISILSEAMVNCPFEERVKDTYQFVDEILQEISRQAKRVTAMTRHADEQVVAWGNEPANAPELGVRFEMAARPAEDVLLETASKSKRAGPITDWEPIKMPVYDRFKATKTAKFPGAYFIPASAEKVVALLRRHGIKVEKFVRSFTTKVDDFNIEKATVAAGPFQGHRFVRLDGNFTARTINLPEGSFVVKTSQPLGVLAFDLLEPESLDGVAAWGFFGEDWSAIRAYPIEKGFLPVLSPTIVVP
jgi:hypothetical protein